jgi:hypothetical protein
VGHAAQNERLSSWSLAMKLPTLLAALSVALAGAAGAQTLKPGLWEITHRMQGSGGQVESGMAQMQQQMAGMPPEQRKMVEEMMARQGVKSGPGGMSMKTCMTPAMVERNELPAQQGDCKTTHQSRTGNVMKFAMACSNPPSTGEGQVTFTSPEAYSMQMAVTSHAHGKPEKTQMEGSGKWLGPDCGSVKPPAARK